MDWGWIGLAATALAGVLGAIGSFVTGQRKAKAEVAREAADREQAAYVAAYQEAMRTKDGELQTLRNQLAHQQQVIADLQEENMDCREAFAKAVTCINFLDLDRQQTHREMVAAGLRQGDCQPMPVSFQGADPASFRRHQAELKDHIAESLMETVKEQAKKVLPPEAPHDPGH